MSDVIPDYIRDAANSANNELGKTKFGKKILNNLDAGKKVLTKYEESSKYKIDSLTGINQREPWTIEATREMSRAKRYKEDVAIVFLDVDGLKIVNDSLGHSYGDLLLKIFSKLMQDNIRKGDIIGRWGGDEFAILLANIKDLDLNNFQERFFGDIKAGLSEQFKGIIKEDLLDFSYGIAKWDGIESLDDLVKRADQIMYKNKQEKRTRRNR